MTRKTVFALALPIIGESFLQTAVVAADTLMVSKIDKESVAGVGTAAELVFFIISILVSLEVGATVLISQAFGGRDLAKASRLARQALGWGVLLALPISLIGYFAAPSVINLFGTEPDVAEHATTYLQITAATSVFLLLTFVSSAIFRGVGDSRTPLYASLVSNAVNLVVAWVLIFGHFGLPELGVAGSAWGAAAARASSTLILVTLLARGKKTVSIRGFRGMIPRIDIGRQLFRLGLPASVEQALMSFGFMTLLAVVAILGTAAIAAQQIAFTAMSVAFMPGFGFAMAATALVGQSVGAQRLENAWKAAKIAERWAVLWMLSVSVIFLSLAHPVLDFFSNDADVIDNGTRAIRAFALSLPFWGLWAVNGGALRGLGDTKTPLVASVVTVWSAVGLSWLAVEVFDQGLGTIWLMFLVTAPIGSLVNRTVLHRKLQEYRPVEEKGPEALPVPA
jgi:putative MATE family efflux protein